MCGALAPGEVIREMALEDLDEVIEIEQLSFVSPWTRRLFEETLGSSISTSFVVKRGGLTVGYIILYSVESEAHILNIAVHPEYRRKGYGASLINHVVDHFKARRVTEFFLEVREGNTGAISLYSRYGFEKIGKRKKYYTETNEDAVVMRLSLPG
ncbi:MAG: Acetyltransferase YpeA [Syntrophorhabdus sp. PtaU1.Bin153]|nr:MAG: Acetyltransferase YpeA [Syntrophorhabdus sp. PtaU1.Bin153]